MFRPGTVLAALALVASAACVSDHAGSGSANPSVAGLTGAALPPATAGSAPFDERRLNRFAGAFPPLTRAPVVAAADAHWLHADSRVLGAVQGDEARAYPLLIMQFHHVANDWLGGAPYLATF